MQSCQEKKHFPVKQTEQELRIQTRSIQKPTWTEGTQSAGGRRKQRNMQAGSGAAVGGSSVSRAFIRGKMYDKNGVFCLNHHLQAKNVFLCLQLHFCPSTVRSVWGSNCSSRVGFFVSLPGFWIHLDVECASCAWNWRPGDLKSCDSPRSDRDMSAFLCS